MGHPEVKWTIVSSCCLHIIIIIIIIRRPSDGHERDMLVKNWYVIERTYKYAFGGLSRESAM